MSRRHPSLMFPPGTCQQPKFYWRGGDEFKEQENIQKDYFLAKKEHSQAKKEFQYVQKEYEQVSQTLQSKDKQAVALASSLGGESSNTEENSKLNKQIDELTKKIRRIEEKINDATEISQPMYISQLVREKSELYVSVEKLSHEIETMEREIKSKNSEYYKCLTGDELSKFNFFIAHHHFLAKERTRIRSEVNKSFEDQNYAKVDKDQTLRIRIDDERMINQGLEKDKGQQKEKEMTKVLQEETERRRLLQDALEKRKILQKKLEKAQLDKQMRDVDKNALITSKLNTIEQLNSVLSELELEEINVEELTKKYLSEENQSDEK